MRVHCWTKSPPAHGRRDDQPELNLLVEIAFVRTPLTMTSYKIGLAAKSASGGPPAPIAPAFQVSPCVRWFRHRNSCVSSCMPTNASEMSEAGS